MDRPKFDAAKPDLALVRQVVMQRLRKSPDWTYIEDDHCKGFKPFVELDPPRLDDAQRFDLCVLDVFWQMVTEGILAPGTSTNPHMACLPRFHVTDYGRAVLAEGDYVPHDQTGYLGRLTKRIPKPDATVLAYLEESLSTFARGNLVACMVMLGIASERVFDIVCDSLLEALSLPSEKTQFSTVLASFPMKPKLDWVDAKLKIANTSKLRRAGYPENAPMMVLAIYNLMRAQRNDLGHPQDDPPRLSREEANANLQIFPVYYQTAEALRSFLSANKI